VGWAVALFKILVDAWGFNVVPLLSSLTASSLIIGLAAQPLLANAIAGLAVFTSRQVVPGWF
jgi:small-conductance mechanosensitive channel